jgi:glyoxylase-like metal-dependent hydrolase (beta-lactamase superfamily II)
MRRMSASPTAIADGVWRLTRGFPLRINVFFVREEGGVAVFDTGHKPMGKAVRAAADALGGATRIVLGNPHADHRGGAKAIGAPVHCHVDDRENVEGDGAAHDFDFGRLPAFSRAVTKKTFAAWDDGPLPVAATLVEGDRVGDFAVIHLPGHSPGTIALWRASDRLAITNDCFALFHPAFPFPGRRPRVPHPAFNWSTERAATSIGKLAGLEPATCWPAHYGPVTGDVAAKLRAAI